MLHIHVFLVAPLGTGNVAQACTYQHQGGVPIRETTDYPCPAICLSPPAHYPPFKPPVHSDDGFSIFSHSSGSITYSLTPVEYTPANWSVLQSEINAGRPLMLGFANAEYDGGHMTVCVGYEICGNTKRVYLADGWNINKYVLKPFNTTENDFMSVIHITW